ncbi:hypothetical protein IM538_14805 [Cytobacillus suaedae]|nr:hypothetical protein IM538_14805 [Cytobacillus suaedae]
MPVLNSYRSRLRILLILYYFSEEIEDVGKENISYRKKFKSEVRIQKIDFLIRYPDYLAAELLWLIESGEVNSEIQKNEIKSIIINIFRDNEPEIKREDMLRFFFGAYEDIDDIIAFLVSVGFIEYTSKRSSIGRIYEKVYYLTNLGCEKIENEILTNLEKASWYKKRCEIIKVYFGSLTGSELKVRQYEHKEYKSTPLNEYIIGIQFEVVEKFRDIFNEELV